MTAIAIVADCTEFGQTFTAGQVAQLTPLQALALASSGMGYYPTGTNPQTPMPLSGPMPITSVMFADPITYGLDDYPDRVYEFAGGRYFWGGSSLVAIGLGGELTVTVSSGELLALNATPKTIIAAPPAGFAAVVRRVSIHKPAGTAYAGIAAGEDLVLKYTNGSGAQVCSVIETTGFLDQSTAQTRIAFSPASSGSTPGDFNPVAAAPVVLHLLVGEITTGTSPLNVRVRYDLVKTVF